MSIPASDCDLAEGGTREAGPSASGAGVCRDTFIHYLGLYTAHSARSDIIMMILLSDTDLMHYFIIIYNS